MATLKQKMFVPKTYIGWYGVCPEDGENACEPFKLISDTNEHTILPGSPTTGDIGTSQLIDLIISYENVAGSAYNGKVNKGISQGNQGIKELICGNAYIIVLKPGTDAENLLEFTIPEFVIGNIESDEKEADEYILTTTCGVAPTPTPTTPECVTSPVTITVESEYIGPGDSEYKYITSDSSGAGGLFGCIDVVRGSTLTINVAGDDVELVTHPLKITEFRNDGHPGTPRTDVVKTMLNPTGPTHDETYSLTWVVPCDETVDKYQYQCEDHAHMRGTINVVGTECPTPTPTPVLDCCDASLNTVNVVAEQVSEFGSPRVVASGFSYSGELCCGNGSVGTPNSVNLYVNGYTPSVGVISFAGQLDSNEIYLKVTDDPFSTNGVPVMTGECLKGIVNGDECILEIQ